MWAGPSMFLGVAMVRYSQRFDTLMRGVRSIQFISKYSGLERECKGGGKG